MNEYNKHRLIETKDWPFSKARLINVSFRWLKLLQAGIEKENCFSLGGTTAHNPHDGLICSYILCIIY